MVHGRYLKYSGLTNQTFIKGLSFLTKSNKSHRKPLVMRHHSVEPPFFFYILVGGNESIDGPSISSKVHPENRLKILIANRVPGQRITFLHHIWRGWKHAGNRAVCFKTENHCELATANANKVIPADWCVFWMVRKNMKHSKWILFGMPKGSQNFHWVFFHFNKVAQKGSSSLVGGFNPSEKY